ncbi:cytochrome P450 [Streptacidiphilus carbonis]|uniref:cytochrome P450 n=1 Tax=Streptacidiphilus carbonis TaxID=105422 RepID=UPI0005A953F2|nr:cytochrome P450 [Streptacidiphilus carbonis]
MRLLDDPNGFLVGAWRQYGDLFRLRIQIMGDVMVVADPQLIREMLVGDQSLFLAGQANQLGEPMVGARSLFLTDGDDHVWQRRLILPPFHARKLQSYVKQIEAISAKNLAALPTGKAVATRPYMQAIAMDVILEIVFGVRGAVADRLREALIAMRGPLGTIIMLPWMRQDFGPGSPWRIFTNRRNRVYELMAEEMAARRKEPDLAERNDTLSMLLLATDEEGRGLSDIDIRDQLLTLVTAGYETTATGLAWAVERLSRNPEVLETARAAALNGDDAYLAACARETLRVRPPLYHIARRLGHDYNIGGYEVPAGLAVMIPILLLHQREDIYDSPLAFRPERFLARVDPLDWLPFGGGPRRCVGAYLAELEMQIALKELLTHYTIHPAGTKDEHMKVFHVTLVPKHGGVAVLERI